MDSGKRKEYKVLYYKTGLSLNEFNERIDQYLSDPDRYDCEKKLYASGLFFKRKRKATGSLFSSSMEISFAQKTDYALIAFEYYSPSIMRYLNIFFLILLTTLALTGPDLPEGYHLLQMANWLDTVVSIGTGILLFGLYRLGTRDIGLVIDRVMDSPEKIKSGEYQRLLSGD
jgi:hypothetical protein